MRRKPLFHSWKRHGAPGLLWIIWAIGSMGCADENGSGVCGWLYAPASFVDAGHTRCAAEPAGPSCDTNAERCPAMCGPNEYLLTCRSDEEAIDPSPREWSNDPISTGEREVSCKPFRVRSDGGVTETTYCCHCGR
jgi:hypothetical protein